MIDRTDRKLKERVLYVGLSISLGFFDSFSFAFVSGCINLTKKEEICIQ